MTVKEFVISILTHSNIQRVNFRYDTIRIYPDGYSRDVKKLVEDGHILFDTTEGAHYTVDARPGEPHRMALPAEHIDVPVSSPAARDAGRLNVRENLGQLGGARFRMTIVHEATHALQDYQRHQSDPQTAEGAAYLAGWITALLWNYPRLEPGASANSGHAYARRLAAKVLDGEVGYVIPAAEVSRLNDRVAIGGERRYVFNGI